MDQGDWKTDLLSLDPSSQNDQPSSRHKIFMHPNGHKTAVFVEILFVYELLNEDEPRLIRTRSLI